MSGLYIDSFNLLKLCLPILLIYTIINLFKNRNSSFKAHLSKHVLNFIFSLYMLLLISVTLFPIMLHDSCDSHLTINLIPFASIINDISTIGERGFSLAFEIRLLLMNIGGNILLLMPLGFFIPMLNSKNYNFKTYFFIGLITSLSIETLQFLQNLFHLSFRKTSKVS